MSTTKAQKHQGGASLGRAVARFGRLGAFVSSWFLMAVVALASPVRAEDLVQLERAPEQGALVHGTAPPGSQLSLDGKPVRVDPDGAFVLGFGRDAKASAVLEAGPPAARRRQTLAVARRTWQVQRIDGLPPGQVSPDTPALERIRAEQKRLDAARAVDSAEQGFRGPFAWPASGPISGVYGSQRILNGEPRAPHVGLDIAGPEGAPVRAPAAAVVRLAERDLFFTGGTVILDHGHGVCTLYAHLSAIDVAPGDHLAAGQALGRIGKTGRVTGPHLHFALYWRGVALDPAGVLPKEPPAAN
jgi:murein DD-endopeptidase MepM/ murein hydrolase activator NlpD